MRVCRGLARSFMSTTISWHVVIVIWVRVSYVLMMRARSDIFVGGIQFKCSTSNISQVWVREGGRPIQETTHSKTQVQKKTACSIASPAWDELRDNFQCQPCRLVSLAWMLRYVYGTGMQGWDDWPHGVQRHGGSSLLVFNTICRIDM